MTTTRYLPALLACLCSGLIPLHAAVTTKVLLRPVDVEDVRLSPSGGRLAYMVKGEKSERDFVVLERHNSKFTPIFLTRLPDNQTIEGFQWLAEDYLALSFKSSDEKFSQLSLADISKQRVTVLEPAAHVIKLRWGDDDHVLISTSIGCSMSTTPNEGRCLAALNLRNSGRTVLTPPVSMFPIGFTVFSGSEIYAHAYDPQHKEHALRFDAAAGAWSEMDTETLDQLIKAKVETRIRSIGKPLAAGSWLVRPQDETPIGYGSLPPKRGFTSLSPDFDELEAALETGFNGKHAELYQITSNLQHGLIKLSGEDTPNQFLLWDRGAGFLSPDGIQGFSSKLEGEALGATRYERSWVDGVVLTITQPPQSVTAKGIVIAPAMRPLELVDQQLGSFDGEAQALAMRGLVYIRLPLATPEKFADGIAAEKWRKRIHQTLQMVIDRAASAFSQNTSPLPICLFAEDYAGSLILTDGGFNGLNCTVGLNAPLMPNRLSERMKISETATMRLSNFTLERQVRGVFASADGTLTDPAYGVQTLPNKIMLAYDFTDPVNEVFARESSAFRSAVKKAGKTLTYTAPLVGHDDALTHQAQVLDSIINFVLMTASPAADTTKH